LKLTSGQRKNKLIVDKSDPAPEASGFLYQINVNFIFNLCMYENILKLLKGASDYFQKVSSNLTEANILLKSTQDTLKTMRQNDKQFALLYSESVKICEDNNIEIPSKDTKPSRRIKKIPKRLEQYLITSELGIQEEEMLEDSHFKTGIFSPH
jgi:hypothetical protein